MKSYEEQYNKLIERLENTFGSENWESEIRTLYDDMKAFWLGDAPEDIKRQCMFSAECLAIAIDGLDYNKTK